MSRKAEMRTFMQNHKGMVFSASSLADSLGWTKTKTVTIKDDEGNPMDVTKKRTYSGTARKIARKSGARVERTSDGYRITC